MRRACLPVLAALVLGGTACGDDDVVADPEQFCVELDRLTANDPFATFGDAASADELREGFAALVARSEELADLAPEEARANARAYADASQELQAQMDAADYDGAELDARAYREAVVTYNEAATALERYLEAEC